MNIHNFANRNLCEYKSIYPTVAALLDHLLFTIGNGYDIDPESGMIIDGSNVRLDEYPEMDDEQWENLIQECHEKERGYMVRFSRQFDENIDEAELKENCIGYKKYSVTDADFTEESLYNDLRSMVEKRNKERGFWGDEAMLRPYPLSEKYSDIFNLNENTPQWFLKIGLNLCKAWVKFLNEELEAGRVWVKPSLRPKKDVDESVMEGFASLFAEIKKDEGYDGWLDRPEPERDYADLEWTTEHRNMLVGLVSKFEGMIDD